MTPYEAWHQTNPALSSFRTFGCVAHIKVTRLNLKKLDDCSIRTVFIGYENGCTTIYKVYDLVAKRVYVTRDTVFDEAGSWDCAAALADQELLIIEYTPSAVIPAGKCKLATGEAAQNLDQFSLGLPAGSSMPKSEGTLASEYMSLPPNAMSDTNLLGEEASWRYRALDSIYADNESAGTEDMLLLVAGEEPIAFTDTEPHEDWRNGMLEELASINDNNT